MCLILLFPSFLSLFFFVYHFPLLPFDCDITKIIIENDRITNESTRENRMKKLSMNDYVVIYICIYILFYICIYVYNIFIYKYLMSCSFYNSNYFIFFNVTNLFIFHVDTTIINQTQSVYKQPDKNTGKKT